MDADPADPVTGAARRAMTPALAIRMTLLMTQLPDSDYAGVMSALTGDLADVPWQRPCRVPTAAMACAWRAGRMNLRTGYRSTSISSRSPTAAAKRSSEINPASQRLRKTATVSTSTRSGAASQHLAGRAWELASAALSSDHGDLQAIAAAVSRHLEIDFP